MEKNLLQVFNLLKKINELKDKESIYIVDSSIYINYELINSSIEELDKKILEIILANQKSLEEDISIKIVDSNKVELESTDYKSVSSYILEDPKRIIEIEEEDKNYIKIVNISNSKKTNKKIVAIVEEDKSSYEISLTIFEGHDLNKVKEIKEKSKAHKKIIEGLSRKEAEMIIKTIYNEGLLVKRVEVDSLEESLIEGFKLKDEQYKEKDLLEEKEEENLKELSLEVKEILERRKKEILKTALAKNMKSYDSKIFYEDELSINKNIKELNQELIKKYFPEIPEIEDLNFLLLKIKEKIKKSEKINKINKFLDYEKKEKEKIENQGFEALEFFYKKNKSSKNKIKAKQG